ncbi:MAG: dockerin type I domain-containing protein [Chthoniobacterales bacterium]
MKNIIRFTLPLLALGGLALGTSVAQSHKKTVDEHNGILEKMIVASGNVSMNLDLSRLNGTKAGTAAVRFETAPDSFLPILVYNNELRGAIPGMMSISSSDKPAINGQLADSWSRLVIEKTGPDSPYDLVLRDGKNGFIYFKIDSVQYDYAAANKSLRVSGGRLLITEDFAKNLGRPADANALAGTISMDLNLRPYEVDQINNDNVASAVLPAIHPDNGTTPGPDVIVGDITGVSQFGSNGSYVGLGVGTTSCNAGVVDLDWFAIPQVDHPVIPQNLYRMSGGANNNDRFEQVGQSWLKHAFTALTQNICSLGCNNVGGTHLGSGCSDPYTASLNASQSGLGSRAWVNPFTGAYPSTARDHSGHSETGTSHRVLVAMSDLSTVSNAGATYYAEGQYVTPHEYAWCQAHPGECNMYNNASYRQYSVSGTTSFSFSPVSATVRQRPAITAWSGATLVQIQPAPGTDGVGTVGYKVTNPSPGLWHYEYAVYNQNMDRAIQSFGVPMGCGAVISNIGFHAPPQEPGWANDGTTGNAGYSSTPWTAVQDSSGMSWNTESLAQNPNANAIRWGTMYNFRFDSDQAPQSVNATVGFYKTGAPITVAVQGPGGTCAPLSLTTAVSRKTHGSAGTFDVNLPLTGTPGIESRGVTGDHTIVLTFSNPVVSGNASVTSGAGAVSGSPSFSGNTMTINVSGVGTNQHLVVTASGVTDTSAQTLPDTAVPMDVLVGDVNGAGGVNGTDIAITKSQVPNAVSASNFRSDVNASGGINSTDVSIVKSMSGSSLP